MMVGSGSHNLMLLRVAAAWVTVDADTLVVAAKSCTDTWSRS